MTQLPLNQRIRQFYDQSTNLWLDTWGEHMHHGHYGSEGKTRKDRLQAQEDLIIELLRWGGVDSATNILDAGCGVGGSARFLANKFGANVTGVTLSPVQANAGNRLSAKAGLDGQVTIKAKDMMVLDIDSNTFDLIWSMESAEHIADKQAMFEKFYQMIQLGGSVLLATWCHRLSPPELDAREQNLLDSLCDIYNLPPLCSEKTLKSLAGKAGFQDVETADWSKAVAPFWQEVIRSALQWRTFGRLLATGWSTLRGAWAMRYMRKGFKLGLIRFVVLRATKPVISNGEQKP